MVRQKLGSYIFAERCYSPCQRGCDMVNDCQNGRCKSARGYRKNSWDNHDDDTVHLDTYYHHKSFLGIVRQYYRIICRSGSTLCLCYICKVLPFEKEKLSCGVPTNMAVP